MVSTIQSRAGLLRACSILAIGCSSALVSNPASAGCSPDPTLESSTTTCDGSDADGITVTTNATTVVVGNGASVSAPAGPAITVAIDAPSSVNLRTSTIQVDGSVDGGSYAGIALTDGTLPSGYYGISTRTDVTVGASGSVTGSQGILLGQVAGETSYTFGMVDNAGTISGTSGAAVVSQGTYVAFTEITNRSTGTIYGLSGAFTTIENAGLIDGKSGSAIALSGNAQGYPRAITNSGRIVSSGSDATISDLDMEITNSGEIANTGSGAAITGHSDYYVRVSNQVGGTITSAQGSTLSSLGSLSLANAGTVANVGSGMALESESATITNQAGGSIQAAGTAISASKDLSLVNEGTIIGDVLAGSSSTGLHNGSDVDSAGGIIDGDLVFGAGNDILHAVYTDEGELLTGVTGAIDGGAGADQLQIHFTADRTLDAEIALPTNFENLAMAIDSGAIVTLADGFQSTGAIGYGGGGTLRNETSLTGKGSVISTRLVFGGAGLLDNAGTITSTGTSGGYALASISVARFSNSGTINSQSGGVDISTYYFENSGTIDAEGTAVDLFAIGEAFNSGTIRSREGVGFEISGSSGIRLTNSGTIEGKTVGVALGAGLINTGTISSSGAGIALSNSGILYNRAGATVKGEIMGIAPASSSLWNARIFNAGVIEGDVSFGQTYASFYDNSNTFYALEGGILNGNLALGNGDFLVTSIDNEGDGDFAGIDGTVSASNSYLRYEVNSDTSAVLELPEGFASLGYQLHDAAALILAADKAYSSTLLLSGVGSVDLTADMEIANNMAILSTPMVSAAENASNVNELDIVSHGTIVATYTDPNYHAGSTDPNYYAGAVVTLAADDSFTNTGTITLTDTRGGPYNKLAAISGLSGNTSGGTVINSGAITADGGTGIYGASSINNSGTITASGLAIDSYQDTLVTNSGTLSSTGSAVIQFTYGYRSSIDNTTEGTITGGDGVAIQSSGGTVRNAGTIVGDVNLGWSSYGYSATSGTFYADGGAIEGDLLFGSGSDLLIETGSGFGVSGKIDGGNGTDTIGHVLASSGSVALGGDLPTGFENEFAGALGIDTVTTITSEQVLERDIQVAGNGQIVNKAATNGSLTGYSFSSNSELLADLKGALAILSNEADVAGGISLNVASLSNSAVVGSDRLYGVAVSQVTTGNFAFANSGTIASGEGSSAFQIYATDLVIGTFTNSGSIEGDKAYLSFGFAENAEAPELSFTNTGTMTLGRGVLILGDEMLGSYVLSIDNSGTIASTLDRSAALVIEADSGSTISLSNSGTIEATGASGSAIRTFGDTTDSIVNSGTITGLIDLGGGDDTIVNTGTMTGNVWLGAGDDIFTQLLSVAYDGTADGGAGQDTLAFDISDGGALNAARFDPFVNFETFALTGSGTITMDGMLPVETLQVASGATFELAAGSTLQTQGEVALTGSDGTQTVINRGTIIGDVALGGGDDTYAFYSGASVTGTVNGGTGSDRLAFYFANSGQERVALDLAPYTSFEELVMGSGTGEYAGEVVFDSVSVEGGRLVGAAGSTLTAAGGIHVASGATFGSAGTVIGNIDIAGTLSPGASPGTMTIGGDLSLAAGSTTYFEMTDAQSDAIVVSGATTIADGSSLELTGTHRFEAGAPAHILISSAGGITGGFTTITKSSEVYGFVRQEGDSIVLTNTLVAPAGAGAPLTATVAHINAMMDDGSGSDAFYAAVPSLADVSGTAYGAAIATLHPEAYASAAQLGIDNGLAIASAVRSDIKAPNARAGLFAMGMGLGAWNHLEGRSGTSNAEDSLGGLLAGLGYRFQSLTVAAFAGRAYGHQSISALGARTRASGTFVGGTLSYSADRLALGAAVMWEADTATTYCALFDATEVESSYDLHSLTFDGYAAYSFGLGSSDWKLGPQITVTHVRTNRGAAQETGNEIFALQVSAHDQEATFVSADVRLDLDRQTPLRPNLTLGVQQRVSGKALRASATFGGSTDSLTVAGAMREETFAHVAAGLNWAAAKQVDLFAQGQIHFNGQTHAETINAGVRIAF